MTPRHRHGARVAASHEGSRAAVSITGLPPAGRHGPATGLVRRAAGLTATLAVGPLAAKRERLSAAKDPLDERCVQAVAAIGRTENPRRLEPYVNGILSPPKRAHSYD